MFNNPNPLDRNIDEGIVVQVDPQREVCRVRTLEGRVLDSVLWLGSGGSSRFGYRSTPVRGNRVVISYGLGYPLILGTIPKMDTSADAYPTAISSSNASVDTGNYIPETYGAIPDPNKPEDMMVGDQTITGPLGNLFGVLRGGSVIVRASRLSEIFLSKFDLLVRIVSKQWEHFTDSFSDVSRNIGNRLYRYVGYGTSFGEMQNEGYRFHQIYGDVAAGEAVTTQYNSGVSPPAAGALVFKEKVTSPGSSSAVMYRTLGLNGDEEVWISAGGSFTRMKATGSVLTFSFSDQNTVTIDGNKIDLKHNSGAEITLDSNGIRAQFSGGQINLSSNSVNTTFGGHFVTVSNGGVALG